MYKILDESIDYIKSILNYEADTAIILGSGLGKFGEVIDNKTSIDYGSIPGFPISTVEGHKGKLVFGEIRGKRIIVMQGRIHYYEGYTMKEVVFPVFLLKRLGIKNLIVTNAAGGINKDFEAGELMIITDHINLMGDNPLIGKNDESYGVRFPDMSEPYKKKNIEKAKRVADKLKVGYREGVYAGVTGPYYETAAEVKFLSTIGADAVGMSTVPEVIAANYLGMDVLGISCITNMATGISEHKHNHESVMETAKRSEDNFIKLLTEICLEM